MPDRLLTGKHVLLGVTGGIAAYKAADLCSKLVQAGAQVDVIMTEAATRFIAPLTFAALSGRPARVDMWTSPGGDPIPHVTMAAAADLVVVAPLSANTLARLALGLADNLLTATLLATPIFPSLPGPPLPLRATQAVPPGEGDGDAPLPSQGEPVLSTSKEGWGAGERFAERGVPWVLAPAMESHMWANPITQSHAAALRARGAILVGPGEGRLASGALGVGRMAEPAEILAAARRRWRAAGRWRGGRWW